MQKWSVGYILTSFEASIRTTLLVSPGGNSARDLGGNITSYFIT